jgi:O-antigen/teichoic acid export membrane protein
VTLVLAAPEFIRLVLGERWLPMLITFQLMVIYTFADPLTVVTGNLLMATGHPGWVAQVRAVQLGVFIPAVIGLGLWRGIEGVAVAADLMVVTGAVFLFTRTRRLVDYSLRAMWLWPAVAVTATAVVVFALTSFWNSLPLWAGFVGKGLLTTGLYGSLLWIAEREQLRAGWRVIRGALRTRIAPL